ncbi:MAG TPA: hypothetical protein VGM73_12450 [Candidatus Didemnitutus sp.]|jgi:hypothetical protein
MNTFLKVLGVVALVLIALKLSPLLLLGALIGLAIAAVLGAVGLSLVGVLLAVAVALAVALAPIWIPVLIVLGLISLFRSNEKPVAAA